MKSVSRQEAVEEIRRRADLAALVGRYVKLKRVGRNLVGLCPFHAEKTPSFTVSPAKGMFHCFGCKASGDVFAFLMKIEGKTFGEVLRDLAQQTGVELPRMREESQERSRRSQLQEIAARAAEFYQDCLWNRPDGEAGRRLLQKRGVPEETARAFLLGFAPAGWDSLTRFLADEGVALDDALELGLLVKGKRGPYDVFRQRLIFPIQDVQGRVIGFGGRRLGDDPETPKYINTHQSLLYDKSEVLYGLYQAREAIRRSGRVVLVEGYFDVIGPHAAGIKNLVATCGTALTNRHAAQLRRLAAEVITVFDGDSAGWMATEKGARVLLRAELAPRAVALPQGEDPDSLVRGRGGQALAELLEAARPAPEMLADHYLSQGDDAESRRHALERLLPLVAACADPLRRGMLKKWLAERFSVDEESLSQALRRVRTEAEPASPASTPEKTPHTSLSGGLERLLVWSLLAPELAGQIEKSLLEEIEPPQVRNFLVHLAESGYKAQPAGLLAQLEDEQLRTRLAEMLLKAENLSSQQVKREWTLSLLEVKRNLLRRRMRELTYRIGQAEKSGDQRELQQLLREKTALNSQLLEMEQELKGC